MAYNQSGVNLNAQKLPVNYQEINNATPPALTHKATGQAKQAPISDSDRVGLINSPYVPNNPIQDEFSKERMTNPETAMANQRLIMEAQRRAAIIRQGVTLLTVGTLAYMTLIRKKGFLSIRKHFMKKSVANNADKLKTYTENLLAKKIANGSINSKQIPKNISLSFTETGITSDAKKEAIENLYKVAKEASLLDDTAVKMDVGFAQCSKDEIKHVLEKLKIGKINEIEPKALEKIEKIAFFKKIEKASKSNDIVVTPIEREIVNASSFNETWQKAKKDIKSSIKRSFAGD